MTTPIGVESPARNLFITYAFSKAFQPEVMKRNNTEISAADQKGVGKSAAEGWLDRVYDIRPMIVFPGALRCAGILQR